MRERKYSKTDFTIMLMHYQNYLQVKGTNLEKKRESDYKRFVPTQVREALHCFRINLELLLKKEG